MIVTGEPMRGRKRKATGHHRRDRRRRPDRRRDRLRRARRSRAAPLRRVRDRDDKLADARGNAAIFAEAPQRRRSARGQEAPAALRRGGAKRDRPAVRRRAEARARDVSTSSSPATSRRRSATSSSPSARRRRCPDMPASTKPRPITARRRHRRRHDGRRHRDVLRQCRHPGHAGRDRPRMRCERGLDRGADNYAGTVSRGAARPADEMERAHRR